MLVTGTTDEPDHIAKRTLSGSEDITVIVSPGLIGSLPSVDSDQPLNSYPLRLGLESETVICTLLACEWTVCFSGASVPPLAMYVTENVTEMLHTAYSLTV